MLATHTLMHTHCATCLVYVSSFRSKLYKAFLEEGATEDERWRREKISAVWHCTLMSLVQVKKLGKLQDACFFPPLKPFV